MLAMKRLDLMDKRNYFFAFSITVIILGITAISIWGIPLSNDFKGGSLLEAQFASGQAPEPSQVVQLYHDLGIPDVQISSSGKDILEIRSSALPEGDLTKILDAMSKKFKDPVTARRFDNIGPTVAREVARRGIWVVVVSSIILTVYIALAFRGVSHAFRYGVCTVAALIHDILVMLSLAAITGHFLGWEVDTLFLTALLTVIAFSAQDTIVVFDRIRENSASFRRINYEDLINHSVVQTLTRSINTQMVAVDFILLALALFGGITLRQFATLLLVGMFSGSYSSDFIAAPLLIVWENQEWKTWFRRKHTPKTGYAHEANR
jgi:preprotein translocase subunit SecF